MRGKRLGLFVVLIIIVLTMGLSQQVKASTNVQTYMEGNEIGLIREEIYLNNTYYLSVSTENDVYLIKDEQIVYDYETTNDPQFIKVIPDVNNNDYDELLIITQDDERNNIFLYDSKDQSIIFSYASKMRSFHEIYGYIDRIVSVTDYHIEGNTGIFIAGYNMFALQLDTGKLLWETEATNNLWDIEAIGDINKDKITDYAVSVQTTNVMAISGKNGHVIYNKKVSEPMKTYKVTIETSIWNLQYNKENNYLYASSENGRVYLLDARSGKVLKSRVVFLFSAQLYNTFTEESNSISPFYKKLTVELSNDINHDGVKDLVYYQMIRLNYYQTDALYRNSKFENKLLFLDGLTLTELNDGVNIKNKNSLYGSGIVNTNYNDERVSLLYSEHDENTIHYKMMSLETGNELEDEFVIPNNGYIDGRNNYFPYSIIILHDGKIAILNNSGIRVINGETSTHIPRIMTTNVTLDKDTILVEMGMGVRDEHSYRAYILEKRDLNNQLIWNYQIEQDEFTITQGSTVDFTKDFNNDGYKDVVLISNKFIDAKFLPNVTLINGKTGEVISKQNIAVPEPFVNKELVESYELYLESNSYYHASITSYGFMNDITLDGYLDYFVTNSKGDIYFIDFKENKIIDFYTNSAGLINEKHYSDYNFSYIHIIGDINQDQFNEFIAFEPNMETHIYYKTIYSFKDGVSILNQEEMYNFFQQNKEIVFEDIDHDGFEEIAYQTGFDYNAVTFNLISSKTGELIYSKEGTAVDPIYSSGYDINNDGVDEIFQFVSGTHMRYNVVTLVDIKNNQELFRSSEYGEYRYVEEKTTTPLKSALLYKQNDKYYIAINQTSYWGSEEGESIKIYDLEAKSYIKNIEIEKNRDRYNLPSLGYFDLVQDGDNVYFYKVEMIEDFYHEPYRKSKEKGPSFYIYDVNSESIQFYYHNGYINDLFIRNNSGFIHSSNHTVSYFTLQNDLAITNLSNNQKINKSFDLKFTKYDGPVNIYIDDILVGTAFDEHYKLQMLEGKHTVKISQTDQNGIEKMYSIDIEVTKNNTYNLFIIITTTVLFSLTLLLVIKQKRFKMPNVVEEGSDGDE